jgi:diguanylate cyclase (GGDEF)-like protein
MAADKDGIKPIEDEHTQEELLAMRLDEVLADKARTEELLLHILPKAIVDQLKIQVGVIAEFHPEATVMFADLVDFTGFARQNSPGEVLDLLNRVFTRFDELAARHGLEKIKTIGDAYMVVGGVPEFRADHAQAVARLALDMQREVGNFQTPQGRPLRLRIGINSGPVVAGVLGTTRFLYDLWGDSVNVASRMESQGLPDFIQVTDATRMLLRDSFRLEKRGLIHVKGRGEMTSWFLLNDDGASPSVQGPKAVLTKVARRALITGKELAGLSLADDLTGLNSRHGFLVLHDQLVHAATREKKRILVLLLEVENLGQLNDEHGYGAGDEALRRCATLLQLSFRDSDILGRFTGGTFMVAGKEALSAPDGVLARRFSELARSNPWLVEGVSLKLHETRWNPADPKPLPDLILQMDD